MELPLEPIKRIIKEQTEMRVSQEATVELQTAIETNAEKISQLAEKFADAGGRKTILGSDVVKAVEAIGIGK